MPEFEILIGLTGSRRAGKSLLARRLVHCHGFARMHPFDGGKVAAAAFLRYLGASRSDAARMVDGDIKDIPCPYLPPGPDGAPLTPRFLLEKLGAFFGRDLGPAWTLDLELGRLRDLGRRRIICESIAFEAERFRELGGVIIEISRPGWPTVTGIETDAAVRKIRPDLVFENDQRTRLEAQDAFEDFLAVNGLLPDHQPRPLTDEAIEVPGF